MLLRPTQILNPSHGQCDVIVGGVILEILVSHHGLVQEKIVHGFGFGFAAGVIGNHAATAADGGSRRHHDCVVEGGGDSDT